MQAKVLTFIALTLAIASSCRSRVFTDGENEKKPATGTPVYIPDNYERDTVIFNGIYDVTVRSRGSQEIVCEGTVRIEASLKNTIITGTVPCNAIGAKTLVIGDGKRDEKVDLTPDEAEKAHLDPRIRWTARDGDATYSPYKPDLIGPIIQGAAKYQDIDFKQPVAVRLKTDGGKLPYEDASGIVHVKMLGINQQYKPRNFPTTFHDVVHYQMNASGFDKLSDKSAAKFYEKYEYRWNVQPMRLLSIHIEGPVRDFEKGVLKGFLGDIVAFRGGLVIDMDLNRLLPITDNPLQEAMQQQL